LNLTKKLPMSMLWQKFLDGDIKAFQSVYELYIDDLYHYGVSFYGDKDVVLDCIHDLFVYLFENKKIAKDVNIKFYLFASLRRAILRKKKESEKYAESTSIEAWEYANAYEMNLNEVDNEKLQKLKQQIEKLPKRQREVIYLKYYVGLSYEDIAEIMQVDISSCRTLSFRAIRQLRLDLSSLKTFLLFFF
jgi:RNA polymerase sigma factor (sigma-70 family)